MEPEEVVRRTGLHPLSPGHQFGAACRRPVEDQNGGDPGQTGGIAAGRQDRQTPDNPPRQHLRRVAYVHQVLRSV